MTKRKRLVFGSPEANEILQADKQLRYERKTETVGTIDCPNCHAEIEMISELKNGFSTQKPGCTTMFLSIVEPGNVIAD